MFENANMFYVAWNEYSMTSVVNSLRVSDAYVYGSLNLAIIDSDNGLSPYWRQAIIWTNARILLIRTLGTNFSEILSKIHTFSFKQMYLNILSGKWRPFCLRLNELSLVPPHALVSGWSVEIACCRQRGKHGTLQWTMSDFCVFNYKLCILSAYCATRPPTGRRQLKHWSLLIRINSLAPGRCCSNFNSILFKLVMQNSRWGTHCRLTFRWIPQSLYNKKSTLVQVMAWCHHATSPLTEPMLTQIYVAKWHH